MPITHIGNEDWVAGYFDGYNGKPHESGRGKDYDDGYSRGYETSERESANAQWWEQARRQAERRVRT